MSNSAGVLEQLMEVIDERASADPDKSYTASLLAGGTARIGAKVIEEATEVRDHTSRENLIHEAADLLYHLFVMMRLHGVTLVEVESELAGRFGISGLDEKASRS